VPPPGTLQLAKYCALHSSKGYAVGLNAQKWMLAEEHVKTDELSDELLGHLEDMLVICGSRDYVFFMDAAITERLAQIGSLKTYLEEEAELGAEAGGKLRNSILLGMVSERI